jgi:putative hydrolase of the HAD superfamily
MSQQPALFTDIRAVFFDAVGTLLHPDPPAAEVYANVGRRHGSRLDRGIIRARFAAAFRAQEEFDAHQGHRTDEEREVRRWRTIVAEVLDDVTDPQRCFAELYTHFAQPSAWHCEPGTGAVLAALAARGFALGIASNFDHRLRGLLIAIPQLQAIRHLVISAEVGWRKPAASFFAAVVSAAGLPPQQILFVGDDWDNDHEGSRAAGLRPVLLSRQAKSRADALQIADIAELLILLPPLR